MDAVVDYVNKVLENPVEEWPAVAGTIVAAL